MKLKTIDEILEFAVAQEEAAYRFYTELAETMTKPNMKEVFRNFAREEEGHKQKLLGVKQGKTTLPSQQKVQDLKIGDHLTEVVLRPDLSFQDALIVAMKAEKAAFRLYSELAEATENANARQLFLNLAQEEARHKLRFEVEYDDFMYKDN
jgi:rubrerythrin